MPDRERVIRGLECCLSPNDHENCPYDGIGKTYSHCLKRLVTDAFNLLKEQEPRVLSKCEAEHYADGEAKDAYSEKPPLYIEYKKKPLPYYVKWATLETVYSWMTDFETSLDYGKEFRFWTAKPNSEQSSAVPWEVTENG